MVDVSGQQFRNESDTFTWYTEAATPSRAVSIHTAAQLTRNKTQLGHFHVAGVPLLMGRRHAANSHLRLYPVFLCERLARARDREAQKRMPTPMYGPDIFMSMCAVSWS